MKHEIESGPDVAAGPSPSRWLEPTGLRRWGLYWATVRHLGFEQLASQVRRRRPRLRPTRPAPAPSDVPVRAGWGPRVPRWRGPEQPEVLDGVFEFWGVRRRLDLRRPWVADDLGPAWNYPLHYFDAAPALAQRARHAGDAGLAAAVGDFLTSWIAAHPAPGRGVAWDPYPTALRLVNWLDVLHTLGDAADAAWRRRVLASLHVQAGWLAGRLETHLLGTHLLKDAKALWWAGQVFDSAQAGRWRRSAERVLQRELGRQVRADGSHVEPSLMYHCVALEDVLDLVNLEPAAGSGLAPALAAVAPRMLAFAAGVATPTGDYPLLGDAGWGTAPSPRQLLEYAARLGVATPDRDPAGLRWFADVQIAVGRDARSFLVADLGPVGPPHLSGHGHCDSLSFEWHVDGVPLVVDAGTRSYEIGPERHASRATRAHNTLEIDAREQHEIWAAFRVARRAAVRAWREGETAVAAELVPWHDRGLRCRRRFEFGAAGVRIRDRVEGPGVHQVTSRLHLHPDCSVRRAGDTLHLEHGRARARIVLPAEPRFAVLEAAATGSVYCERLGVARPNLEIAATVHAALPLEYEIVLIPDGAE